jgi:hypothetical protein
MVPSQTLAIWPRAVKAEFAATENKIDADTGRAIDILAIPEKMRNGGNPC